jgi:MAF protein
MLILASGSPRRKKLLSLAGWTFQIIPANLDESYAMHETPQEYVVRLALEKARSVSGQYRPEAVVLAADTAGILEDEILGKPASIVEAKAMLQRLHDRAHQVITGLAAIQVGTGAWRVDWCITDVKMRNYTAAEIDAYVASGDPLDKAGAYAIQHPGFDPVESVNGCYANVVGLPLCHLPALLAPFGIQDRQEKTAGCRSPGGYHCQLTREILAAIN